MLFLAPAVAACSCCGRMQLVREGRGVDSRSVGAGCVDSMLQECHWLAVVCRTQACVFLSLSRQSWCQLLQAQQLHVTAVVACITAVTPASCRACASTGRVSRVEHLLYKNVGCVAGLGLILGCCKLVNSSSPPSQPQLQQTWKQGLVLQQMV